MSSHTEFKLTNNRPVDEFLEAKAAGIQTRPVLIGPISYLLNGKTGRDETNAAFAPIDVIDKLVPVFIELLKKLEAAGATEVQIDEATLCLDATTDLAAVFERTYAAFAKEVPGLKLTVATFFGRLDTNIKYVAKLPIHALHLDLDRAPEQLDEVVAAIKDTKIVLSLGLISGRNVWKNDLAASLKLTKEVIAILGADRVVVATSSSLLHTPVTLASETKLSAEVRDWFSFATEKCSEVATLAKAVSSPDSVKAAFDANTISIKARRDFESGSDSAVRERLAAVTPAMYNRASPFPARIAAQKLVHDLPAFRESPSHARCALSDPCSHHDHWFLPPDQGDPSRPCQARQERDHDRRVRRVHREGDPIGRRLPGADRPRPPRARRARAQRHGPVLWRASQRLCVHRGRVGPVVRLAIRPSPDHCLGRLAPRGHDRALVGLRPVAHQGSRQGNGASIPFDELC